MKKQIIDLEHLREFTIGKPQKEPITYFKYSILDRTEVIVKGKRKPVIKESGTAEVDRFKYKWSDLPIPDFESSSLWQGGYLFKVPVIIALDLGKENVLFTFEDRSTYELKTLAENIPYLISLFGKTSDIYRRIVESFWPVEFNGKAESSCTTCGFFSGSFTYLRCTVNPARDLNEYCRHWEPRS